MSQCKAEERDYAPSVYYCRAEEGHTGPHEYRLAPACCAEARREALEEAAKEVDGLASDAYMAGNGGAGRLLDAASAAIRDLAKEPKP